MDAMSAIALALGASWANGLNLYATTLVLGSLGAFGVVDLPADLEMLETPPVLIIAGVLYAFEFFTEKIPDIDSLNVALHTFIRIPAGGIAGDGECV